jgi:ribonuclease P protein component
MATHSFPKKERLLKRRDFQDALRKGKRYSSSNFVVVVRPVKEETIKIGFIAGKRVGKAPERNRFKRLLREFYRLNKNLFPPSCKIIIIVKPYTPLLAYKNLTEELENLLSAIVPSGYGTK